MEPTAAEIEQVYNQWKSLNKIEFTEALYKEYLSVDDGWILVSDTSQAVSTLLQFGNIADAVVDRTRIMFMVHPEWNALFMFKNYQERPDKKESGWNRQFVKTSNSLDKALRFAHSNDIAQMKVYLREVAKRHVVHNVGVKEFKEFPSIAVTVISKRVPDADLTAWRKVLGFVCENIVTV